MKKSLIRLFPVMTVILVFSAGMVSCKSTKQVEKSNLTSLTDQAYKQKVLENAQKTAFVTAKLRFDVAFGTKDISLNGTLRMKRDDVIQLSLTFLGMEVGRMEFTQNQVLVLDRFNKQYVRVPYDQVSFLQSSQLDFNALQALFWNELFVPGVADVSAVLDRFSVQMGAGEAILSVTDAPRLNYQFHTRTVDAVIDRTDITPKKVGMPALEWGYERHTQLDGRMFPQRMSVKVSGTSKKYRVTFTLSNLKNDSGWNTRIDIPSGYKERNVDDILGKLLNF